MQVLIAGGFRATPPLIQPEDTYILGESRNLIAVKFLTESSAPFYGAFFGAPTLLPHFRDANKKAHSFYTADFCFFFVICVQGCDFRPNLWQPDSGDCCPRCGFLRFTLQERRNFDHMKLTLNSHGDACNTQTVSNMVRHNMPTMIVFCGIALAPFTERR